jgi:pimeloyl-ACP methyl ester carboxylesterase
MSKMPPIAISKAYADTSYGQIHYRFTLPPKNTQQNSTFLLFLHKSASSSVSYDSLMLLYAAKGYYCYAPDMPGFGGSFDPSDDAITEIETKGTVWYADVFMQAFSQIGLLDSKKKTKFHIIGHHSGAVLAIELATMFPELVASICLVGPAVMTTEERAAMKEIYFKPFNEPVRDGSHLLKTWEYLGKMGVGEDLSLWQREAVDHIRAWKGRNLIYGAVWAQESEELYMKVECPIMLMCAKDDVLWKYFGSIRALRPEAEAVEVEGGNFEPDRDVNGIAGAWTKFLDNIEQH